MIKIENCPEWARLILQNQNLYGIAAWSLLWGDKYGPMAEPFFKESDKSTPKKKICIFEPYNINIDSCYVFLHSDGHVYCKGNSKQLWELEQGIVTTTCNKPDEIKIKIMKTLFPGLSINGEGRDFVIVNPSEVQKDAKSSQRFREEPHYISAEDFKKVRKVYEWHLNTSPSHEWVELPDINFTLKLQDEKDYWYASDSVFRGWLLKQLQKFLSNKPINAQLQSIFEAQICSGKGSHQGWSTHLHAVYSTALLDTSALKEEFKAPLRFAMLLHDIGKCNPRAMRAVGAHGALGSKLWKSLKAEFIASEYDELISMSIKHHDLFGLIDRGLKYPNLIGTLSVDKAREVLTKFPCDYMEALNIITAINDADIASVPSLRYHLSLTPHLYNVFAK